MPVREESSRLDTAQSVSGAPSSVGRPGSVAGSAAASVFIGTKGLGSTPISPSWTLRPFLAHKHLQEGIGTRRNERDEGAQPIGSFPLQVQELLIIEDLLSVLVAIDGKFLRLKERPTAAGLSLVVTPDQTLDLSLADLVERIVPLSQYYLTVVRFTELRQQYEFGLVNHALCAAIDEMVREYLILVAQLESEAARAQLTLQRFWFYIQPAMQTLRVLSELCTAVESNTPLGAKPARAVGTVGQRALRGGALLNVLIAHAAAAGGEQHAAKLYAFLVESAAKPYLEMLEKWLYQGVVQDAYGEFMIEEKPSRPYFDDSYWEKRYVQRDAHVPVFLDREVAHKVMTTGKYLTVLRECGEAVELDARKLAYSTNGRVYAQITDEVYTAASARVLALLTEQKNLMERLRSVKRYFLTDRGDWLVQFLDTAHEELSKEVRFVNKGRLESLLALSVVTSVSSTDEFRDDLTCQLMPTSALDEVLKVISIMDPNRKDAVEDAASLTGFEAFAIAYRVEWPLNIVLSNKARTKYRWLFRHLFQYKLAERELSGAWANHQGSKSFMHHAAARNAFALDIALRARMLHFVQSVQHYLVMDVIENCWHTFQENMRSVKTVEEVLTMHDKFLDSCITLFVMNDPALLKIMARTTSTCMKFARYIRSKTAALALQDEDRGTVEGVPALAAQRRTRARYAQLASEIATGARHRETVAKYEQDFDGKVFCLLEALRTYGRSGGDPHLLNLCAQLDFNKYYSDKEREQA